MKCKKYIFFLVLLITLNQAHAKGIIGYDWYWGIETINQVDYFMIDLKPEVNYSVFHLKLNIPIEINTNWNINKNHWQNNNDIVSKIDHLSFSNSNYLFQICSLNNLTMANGELINDYADNILEPLTFLKAVQAFYAYQNYSFNFVLDDINHANLFFLQATYQSERLKTGLLYTLDNNVFEEILVNNQERVSFINPFIDYQLYSGKDFNLTFENDYIRSLQSYQLKNNNTFVSGLKGDYSDFLSFSLKGKYIQNYMPGKIYFNKFYFIERADYNNLIVTANSWGIAPGIGINFFDWIQLDLAIDKVQGINPYGKFVISTSKDFPSKIKSSCSIYNRNIINWSDLFSEKEYLTYFLVQNSVALSENLYLKLDYLKSFHYDQGVPRGVHQILFYSEFVF